MAIAKHLGLQTIRLADSIVLPINTTHHAVELGKYLDKCVPLTIHSLYYALTTRIHTQSRVDRLRHLPRR